jgi:protein-S-isoprenylcysteine O-methyltransferase Ste14
MKILETKIPPPLLALTFALLIWYFAGDVPRAEIGGMFKTIVVTLLVAIGVVFDLSGLVHFRRVKTTINPVKPEKATALVQTGIYRVTRNPMYVGLVFVLSAWCIYLNSPYALVGVAGFILYITTFQILPEERMLITLFGDEYREYQSRVPRWLFMNR